MTATSNFYAKARAEIIALFGWDVSSLSPNQTLRVDCATALRLALDDLQGKIARGESIDVARMLTASEALARLLPPTVLADPPAEQHADPREEMWLIYKQMRERGELGLKALPPDEGLQARITKLESENAQLRAALGGSSAITPREADITPPGEIGGECYAGMRPGPDDPPRAPVIEGRAVPKPPSAPAAPQSSAAPQYDYNREQGWKDYVEADGTIRSTPRGRGHHWGPV